MTTKAKIRRTRNTKASQAFRSILRSVGLKCTNARLSLLRQLSKADGPSTHGELSATLAKRGFDPATIFRNLNEFAAKGIAVRIDAGDHVWRFELRNQDSGGDAHAHFLCVACGKVHCLLDLQLPASAYGSGKAETVVRDVQDVLIRGHCRRCGWVAPLRIAAFNPL